MRLIAGKQGGHWELRRCVQGAACGALHAATAGALPVSESGCSADVALPVILPPACIAWRTDDSIACAPACLPQLRCPAVEASGALAKVLSREEVATTVMPAVVQCSQDKSWRVRYNAVQQASRGQPCVPALGSRPSCRCCHVALITQLESRPAPVKCSTGGQQTALLCTPLLACSCQR